MKRSSRGAGKQVIEPGAYLQHVRSCVQDRTANADDVADEGSRCLAVTIANATTTTAIIAAANIKLCVSTKNVVFTVDIVANTTATAAATIETKYVGTATVDYIVYIFPKVGCMNY